ncbi:DUF3180 family protein [Microbacterium invictum]|uniref:MFS family permease n=1 Tax=Microbacterium invictum TaxID=515415 RepID=A0AA40SQ18_9MICO|nr:DUF3180 domain-containing protein [Microbacterium invictum]MBB4140308.1 MFS family permease [Microbacterium invictum]
MKRTGAGALAIAALVGLVAGFLIDQLLTAGGRPTFTPSVLLAILLALLAMVLVILALPIRRATRTPGAPPVNPFQAVRIAMLAKASSLVGALVAGFGAGLVLFLLTRPVPPSLGSLSAVIAAGVGGLVLVVGSLVAEHMCTTRKDDDDEQPGPDEPGFGLTHRD